MPQRNYLITLEFHWIKFKLNPIAINSWDCPNYFFALECTALNIIIWSNEAINWGLGIMGLTAIFDDVELAYTQISNDCSAHWKD